MENEHLKFENIWWKFFSYNSFSPSYGYREQVADWSFNKNGPSSFIIYKFQLKNQFFMNWAYEKVGPRLFRAFVLCSAGPALSQGLE